jgi:hypothetical protein
MTTGGGASVGGETDMPIDMPIDEPFDMPINEPFGMPMDEPFDMPMDEPWVLSAVKLPLPTLVP